METPTTTPANNSTATRSINATNLSMDDHIDRLCAMTSEAALQDARLGGYNIEQLKAMATHINIPKSQPKASLIEAIKLKRQNQNRLEIVLRANDEEEGGSFRKDKNTFPRLCNILMSMPDALARSAMLANRV
jgi:hypothetical protein